MADDPLSLAVGALRQKERSRAEMARWLAQHGVDDAEVEETLAHLESIGEVDDARFARRFADDKRELSGWGAERIRQALLAREVGEAEIDAAVGEDPDVERDRAAALLERRGRDLGSDTERGRALAFLTRRGFPYEIAYDAVRACERRAARPG